MKKISTMMRRALIVLLISHVSQGMALAGDVVKSSYSPIVINESFEKTMTRMKAAKSDVMKRQMDLLDERYDLSEIGRAHV